MVMLAIGRLLLWLAARWWPQHLRDEMSTEWRAELSELAAEQQHVRMLGFTASLALTRPRLRPRLPWLAQDASVARAVRHGLLLLSGPPLFVVLAALPPALAILLAALPAGVAAVAGFASPLLRPRSIVVTALAPSVAVLLIAPTVLTMLSDVWREHPATAVWALLLAATIAVMSRLPTRLALLAAGVGSIAACWLATTLAVAPRAAKAGLDTAYAPLWYPADLAWPVDLPLGESLTSVCRDGDPSCVPPSTSWTLIDVTEGYPATLTMAAMFTMAYALGATREAAYARLQHSFAGPRATLQKS